MSLIVILRDKHDEVIITEEGFQVMSLTEDFAGHLSFTVKEHVPAYGMILSLHNPVTQVRYDLQVGNHVMEPGDTYSVDIKFLEAVKNVESPKH